MPLGSFIFKVKQHDKQKAKQSALNSAQKTAHLIYLARD
jgi:hypothetical protein